MKKTLAIVLALVLAFSMSAMAFAAEGDTTTTAAAAAPVVGGDGHYDYNTCKKCGANFVNEQQFNNHVAACTYGVEAESSNFFSDLSIKDVLSAVVELVKSSNTQWDDIESVVNRLVDLVEKLLSGITVSEADVNGAIDDLKAKTTGDSKLCDLLDSLKAKIMSFYAGDKATTEATTAAEEPADTGSATAGIAAFAAISVAAAAAYVCTKKKA